MLSPDMALVLPVPVCHSVTRCLEWILLHGTMYRAGLSGLALFMLMAILQLHTGQSGL